MEGLIDATVRDGIEHAACICQMGEITRWDSRVKGSEAKIEIKACTRGETVGDFHTHPGLGTDILNDFSASDLCEAIEKAGLHGLGGRVTIEEDGIKSVNHITCIRVNEAVEDATIEKPLRSLVRMAKLEDTMADLAERGLPFEHLWGKWEEYRKEVEPLFGTIFLPCNVPAEKMENKQLEWMRIIDKEEAA